MRADSVSLTKANNLQIGVLLIGSLYWCDRDHRRDWRNRHLHLDERKYLKVPIRYGRRSATRQGCFTMVFSTSLNEQDFGRAIVVPCKAQDLIKEAVRLWTAETPRGENDTSRISARWGRVGLLENPDNPMSDGIRNTWITKVRGELTYGHVQSARREQAAVDEHGFLKIPWPRAVDNSDLELHAILATATDPTIVGGEYPTVEDIAVAWKSGSGKKEAHYFWNNRKYRIETFEDDAIEEILNDA